MANFDTDILLATYNGAEFLEDLLRSLDDQTDQEWRLVVRDDGSKDATLKILLDWARDKEERFHLIEDGRANLGAAQNFGTLLEACTSRYFLPCDQDDVWLPHKIASLRTAIKLEEEKTSSEVPIIVHTDLIVTDSALRPMSNSFWQAQRIRALPDKDPWKLITWQNVVTGCAMIGNSALLRVALPIPQQAMVHDWWLGLIGALTGKVVACGRPSVLYRQHARNTLGLQDFSPLFLIKSGIVYPKKSIDTIRVFLARTRLQSNAALEHLGARVSDEKADFLRDFSSLESSSFLKRKAFIFQHNLGYSGRLRNFVLCVMI